MGGVSGQYCTQIYGDYLFHSVPYTERYNKGSLQPGEFDKLGTSCSHGCIRLQVADAKWIYDNKYDIAGVTIYDSDDPGPLGKPSYRRQRLSRLGPHGSRQRQSVEQACGCDTGTETRTGPRTGA